MHEKWNEPVSFNLFFFLHFPSSSMMFIIYIDYWIKIKITERYFWYKWSHGKNSFAYRGCRHNHFKTLPNQNLFRLNLNKFIDSNIFHWQQVEYYYKLTLSLHIRSKIGLFTYLLFLLYYLIIVEYLIKLITIEYIYGKIKIIYCAWLLYIIEFCFIFD